MSPVAPGQPHQPARPEPPSAGAGEHGDQPKGRPGPSRPGKVTRGRAPLLVAAAVATAWAVLVSYLPVAIVVGLAQFTEDGGGIADTARLGLAGWLLGHHVPLNTDAGPLGLSPLAIAMLSAWRLSRAGVHVSRAVGARHRGSLRQAVAVAGAVGVGYGLLGGVAGLAIAPTVSPMRAAGTLTVFGGVSALVGALRTTGALGPIARRVPTVLRDGVRTGVVAALLLLGAGAGTAGLAVATGGGDASSMIGAYRTGVAGQAGITLVSAVYAPNAAVWATSYLLGPGFAVGTDTAVRTTEVSLGALPAVPLIAGLPSGPVSGFGAVLLAVPVLAGMAAGWLLSRRAARTAEWDRTTVRWGPLLGAAAVGGPVAGALLWFAAVMSSGPLGGGRLVEVGPVGWQVAAVATVVLAVGGLIGAAATRAFVRD